MSSTTNCNILVSKKHIDRIKSNLKEIIIERNELPVQIEVIISYFTKLDSNTDGWDEKINNFRFYKKENGGYNKSNLNSFLNNFKSELELNVFTIQKFTTTEMRFANLQFAIAFEPVLIGKQYQTKGSKFEMNLEKKCNTCSAFASTVTKLKKCGRCLKTYYCDSVCQKQDWKSHKITCIKKGVN